MPSGGVQADCVAALQLQRERSSTYQQWTSLFHRALIGDITPSELQRNIQGIVLPEFQRVSTALRTMQKRLRDELEGRGTAAENKHQQQTALVQWIEQLQNLEREHYTVTLSLANQLVDHCTPNVLASSTQAVEASAAEAPPPRHVTPGDLKSLFKPDDSDDERQMEAGEVEYREKKKPNALQPAHPPLQEATAGTDEAPATLRVHDAERCALLHLIPPRCHAHLFFVECRDGMDDDDEEGLSGGSPSPSKGSDHQNHDDHSEGEDESLLLPLYAKEAAHRAADGDGRGAPIALYSSPAVAHRCVAWSHTSAPIVRRQATIRAAIEELCEELQSDISDM